MPSGNNLYLDSLGRFRTRSLFIEMIQKEQVAAGYVPLYTLRGHPSYMDVHRAFVDSGDPTEYQFGIQVFSTWEHYQYMLSLDWFRHFIEIWREELEISMKSKAIAALMRTAVEDGNKGITAAKYIADFGWQKKRGRPSKEEIAKETRMAARIKEELFEDAKRLGLH